VPAALRAAAVRRRAGTDVRLRTSRSSRSRGLRLAEAPAARPVAAIKVGPVRILGLDPGSQITGFGVVDASPRGLAYVASGSIRTGDGTFSARLHEIFAQVGALMREYSPGEVAIEQVFMHRNPDSALKLGQARGAALCGLFESGVGVFEYTPRQVKLAVTGTGAADKQQVQHMIKALLAVEGRLGLDASDALALAVCHANHRTLLALGVGR
jgi:crossover junction endodeoxyribonuclease RuvC